jgi:hypothetical protein
MLSPVDLSSFAMEALRTADVLHLVMSRTITGDDDRRVGLAEDPRYVAQFLSTRFAVEISEDDHAAVLHCRAR